MSRRAAALAGVVWLAAAMPAHAIELFGFTFFEDEEEVLEEGAVPYEVELIVEGDDELESSLRGASSLVRGMDDPPLDLVGLVARARADRRGLVGELYSQARYGGVVRVFIDGRPLPEISVLDEDIVGEGAVPVTIEVEPGTPFALGAIDLAPLGDAVDAYALATSEGLVSGAPAGSAKIGRTEGALIDAWRDAGHPFAERGSREIVADHAVNLLDVALRIAPGPIAVFGAVEVSGTDRMKPGFIEYMADIPTGERYDPEVIADAARRLRQLPALGSVTIREGDSLVDGALPLGIQVSERKPRVIGAGVEYDSTEGFGVSAYWQHRNLFGRAETLRLEAEVSRLGAGGDVDDYEGKLVARFTKPGVFNPYTRFETSFALLQEAPDAYKLRGVFADAFLITDLTDRITLRGGIEGSFARIEDVFGPRDYALVGLPLSTSYDARDEPLDPTRGFLVEAEAVPYYDFENQTTFLRADIEGSVYFGFGRYLGGRFGTAEVDPSLLANRPPRVVLAARLAAGALLGLDDVRQAPPDKRFYAGGGGSVRGYSFRGIGPRLPGTDQPFGGLARIDGSLEARVRVTENIGVVPFIDAGAVSEALDDPNFDDIKVGAGLGLRYRTPVGPIRLDVAFPLDPGPNDADFAFYVGIGQAF